MDARRGEDVATDEQSPCELGSSTSAAMVSIARYAGRGIVVRFRSPPIVCVAVLFGRAIVTAAYGVACLLLTAR